MGYRRFLKRLHVPLTVAVVLAQTAGAYLFGSGLDFALFREATLSGHNPYVWLPPYGYWLLRPIMLLPSRLSLALLVLLCSGLMALTGYVLTGSGLPALLSSAGFLAAETGQIDGFVALGLAVGVLACEKRKPHLLGIALLLMSLKPQITLIAAVWMVWTLRDWRVFLIPAGVLGFSLVTDGLWPLALLQSPPLLSAAPQNISLWRICGPFLLPLAALPFLFRQLEPRRAVVLAVAVSALTMPYYSAYSLSVPFAVGLSPWLLPVTYVPLLPWPDSWAAWRIQVLAIVPAVGLIVAVRYRLRWRHPETIRTCWKPALVLLLAFLVRMVRLQARALWYDEAFAVLYASLNPARIVYGTVTPVEGAGAADVHPLLYYFILHGWMGLAGRSPLAARFLSVLLGMLTVTLVWRLAAWCFGRRTGLVAGLLAAVNPFHVAYSQEARMYALLAFGAILAVWSLLHALAIGERERQGDKETRGQGDGRPAIGDKRYAIRRCSLVIVHWSLYAVAAALTLYAHNLGVFVLLALHLLVVARRRWRRHLPALALADLGALALFSPWLIAVLPGQVGFVQRGYWLAPPGADELVRAVMLPVLTFYEDAPFWLLSLGLLTSLLLLALLALRVWRTRSPAAWFLFLWWAPVGLLWLISHWRPLYLERALLPSALLGLVAVGWLFARGGLPRWLNCVLVALLTVSTAGSLIVHYAYTGFPRPPFQEAAAYLRAHIEPGDVVVHTNKLTYFPMRCYAPEVAGAFLADPPGSPQDTLAYPTQEALGVFATSTITEAVGTAERVWLIYFPREVEEMQALGADHPALAWLESGFSEVSRGRFGDLAVALYRQRGP